jgi:hypothetical protein
MAACGRSPQDAVDMGSKRLQLLTSGLLCAGGGALVAFGYFYGGGAAIAVGVCTAIQVLIARNR